MRAAVTPLTGHRGKRPSQTPWQPPLRRFVRALKVAHTHTHSHSVHTSQYFHEKAEQTCHSCTSETETKHSFSFCAQIIFCTASNGHIDCIPTPSSQNKTHTAHWRIAIHTVGFNLGLNALGVRYNGWLTLSFTLREWGAIGVEQHEALQPRAPFKPRTKLMTTNEYTVNKHYPGHTAT